MLNHINLIWFNLKKKIFFQVYNLVKMEVGGNTNCSVHSGSLMVSDQLK